MARPPIFVFELDSGDIQVVDALSAAAAAIEPHDVAIAAVSDADGQLFRAVAEGEETRLVKNGGPDRDALEARLKAYVRDRALPVEAEVDIVHALANTLLQERWSTRWPRWPKWLDRRLHGVGPAQYTS